MSTPSVERSSADNSDLIERLRNPMWAHSNIPFDSPQLEQEENLSAMIEAANMIINLRQQITDLQRLVTTAPPQEAPVRPEKAFELTPFMVKLLRRAWSNGCIPLADDMAFRHAEIGAMREMAKHGFVRSAEVDRSIPGPPQPPGWEITEKGREAASTLSRPNQSGT